MIEKSPAPVQRASQSLLIVLLVIAAYLVGSLSTEIRYLKGNSSSGFFKNLLGQKNLPTTVTPTPKPDVLPLQDSDHVRGPRDARIILIEYSDLECPFCKAFHLTAQKAVDEYNGQVAWVYRHFPLDNLHPKADKEAEAVECAGKLNGEDGFWLMVDKIFEVTPSNNGLNLDDLPKLAGQIGVDAVKFKECLDSGKFAQHVEDDYQSGLKAGVQGTPGTILLDTKSGKTRVIPGAVPYEQLKQIIDELIKSS